MELWIRSQDRTKLMKVDEVEFQADDYGFYIFAWKDKFEGSRTGTYATKERALEVLDEIQNILKPKYILDSSSIRPDGDSWVENGIIMQKYNANARIEEITNYVYEMPKE